MRMHKGLSITVLACSLLALLASCEKVPHEYKEFLQLPRDEQLKVMQELPIERRIDLYLAGETYARPSLKLSDVIVSEGKSSVPFLLRRLETERRDFRRVAIIEVLEDIDRHHTDLTDDAHLVEVLRRVVLEIENPLHRERAEYMVNSISSEQPTNPLEHLPAR